MPLSTFRKRLIEEYSRDELLDLIKEQDPELLKQVRRIEWVFANKLRHLNWTDGSPIEGRPLTEEELALLIDEPFTPDKELTRMGVTIEQQHQIHVAKDPVLWARHFLNERPRVYQIIMLRDPSTRKVLRAGRRLGKALALDTPIPTPTGWTTMGELREGDQVFDEHGKPCNIIFATDIQHNRKCYDIVFSDGEVITADADHQWTVDTKSSRKARGRAKNPVKVPITVTTEQMRKDLYVQCGGKLEVNYSIEVAGAVEYPEKQLPINPYILGAWLGDGTALNGSITTADDQMLDEFRKAGYELTKWQNPYVWSLQGLSTQLRKLGIRNNPRRSGGLSKKEFHKRIPVQYLQGSVFQREELLKGLMDTDGSVVDSKCGGVEFSVVDEVLANDVWELVKSLGYKATLRKDPEKFKGIEIGIRYRIYFTPWRPVFRLERKLSQQHLRESPSARQRCRYIVDIRERESVPVKCISVDSPSSLYLAGKNFIPTHNTWVLALILLHYSYTNQDGKCLVVAPMKSHVELIYKELMRMIKGTIVEESIVRAVTSPQFVVEFTNGSTVRMFTSGMKSGGRSDVARGQEAHIIILDELDYMGEDDLVALYAMLQQTAENQVEKILVGASTPTGQRGTFWEWCNGSRFREFYYPSYCNPFFTKEIEEEMREQYTNPMDYRHEIEADWGEDTEGVYPRKYVDIAFHAHDIEWRYDPVRIPDNSFYLMGVDWDKYGAGVNIVILEVCLENHSNEHLRNKLRVYYREEVPKGEYTLLNAVQRIIDLNAIFNPRWIYVDRGYGEAQFELLRKHGVQHPITELNKKVIGHTFSDSVEVPDPVTKAMGKKEIKPFMVNNLRQLLEEEMIVFPEGDEGLYLQLISYVVRSKSILGRPSFEMAGNVPDHAHDALILACLAYAVKYSDLMKLRLARKSYSISNEVFLPTFEIENGHDQELAEDTWGSPMSAPIKIRRNLTAQGVGMSRRSIRRSSF